MDFIRADYFTVASFGTVDMFEQKIKIENKDWQEIFALRNSDKMSLLEESLSFRNFALAKLLLKKNCDINVISKQRYNELHYIAANISYENAVEIATELIQRGVDLNLKDKKFGNTPFCYFCLEASKKNGAKLYPFLQFCLQQNPDVSSPNLTGCSILDLIARLEDQNLINLFKEAGYQ